MPLQSQIPVQQSHGNDYKQDNDEIQITYQHVCRSFRFTAGQTGAEGTLLFPKFWRCRKMGKNSSSNDGDQLLNQGVLLLAIAFILGRILGLNGSLATASKNCFLFALLFT